MPDPVNHPAPSPGSGPAPSPAPGAVNGPVSAPSAGPGAVNGPVSGSVPDPRAELARAQAELLAALVAGGEPPRGFDEGRLRIQAASLISKRRGVVARIRPDLVALLGAAGFAAEFDAYARGRPKPPGGSRVDARDFAERLRAAGHPLPEPAPEPPAGRRRWARFTRALRDLPPVLPTRVKGLGRGWAGRPR
ncbi:hypothetical protein GCM10027187_20100 [Streptosporangium sandarakinum]